MNKYAATNSYLKHGLVWFDLLSFVKAISAENEINQFTLDILCHTIARYYDIAADRETLCDFIQDITDIDKTIIVKYADDRILTESEKLLKYSEV